MSTEIMIDAALIVVAVGYLFLGRFIWRDIQDTRQLSKDKARIDKTVARARQLRELTESRFWS